jgi:glycosyltransferase involved in cell wall biosynthesis
MKSILFGVTIPMTANAFLKPQIKALISEGWDVHLVCNLEPGIEELARIAGLRVHPIPMKRNPNPIGDLISLYRWINLLRKLRPNIVIGSTPKAALLSMLGSKFTKIPVRIYHARGFRAEGLTGVAKKISLLTEKITIKLATEILCDSSSLRDSLINHGCLPKNSGIVIGLGSCCGVDTEFFRPPSTEEKEQAREKLGYKHEDFIVGFVGRLTTDKGIN